MHELRDGAEKIALEPPQAMHTESRLRRLLARIQALVLESTPDGCITFINEAAAEAFGCAPEQLVGTSAAALFPEAQASLYHEFIARFHSGQDLKAERLTMVSGTGQRRVIEWSTANRYENGTLTRIVALGIDRTAQEAAVRALRETERRFRVSMDALPVGILVVRDGRLHYGNRMACKQLGWSASELTGGMTPLDIVVPAERSRIARKQRQRHAGQPRAACDIQMLRKDGSTFIGRVRCARATFEDESEELVVSVMDVTGLREAERSIKVNQVALDRAGLSVLRMDMSGRILYANASAAHLFGYDTSQLRQHRIQDFDPSVASGQWDAFVQNLAERHALHFETVIEARDGTAIPVEVDAELFHFRGEPYLFSYAKDLRLRNQALDRIEQLTYFDALSGLPNRELMTDRLEQALSSAAVQQRAVGVAQIEIDRLELVTGSLGRAARDEFVREAARRIVAIAGAARTVAHPDAATFVLVASGERDVIQDEITHAASRVREALAEPFSSVSGGVYVSCSIGVALFPRDGQNAQELLRNCATAVNQAHQAGPGSIRFYTPETDARARDWLLLEAELRRALAADELHLQFQPQVDLASGAIYGVEALLRWTHPALGEISPARIIPIAEETGLIARLGEWVLGRACEQAVAWQAQGLRPISVSVNVSPRQVHEGDFFATVSRVLQATGLAPQLLELELTESVLLEDLDRAIATFQALRRLGVRLALDDFGTGYSSLKYLKQCPLDTIKIDKSFVHDAGATLEEASITRAIINIARALNLAVIAEGVQSEEQLEVLLRYQCDAIQGYYFSPPASPERVADMIRDDQRLAVDRVRAKWCSRTLLIVDDEPNILAALRRLLRNEGYQLLTASSPQQALSLLAMNNVDVILSDQRMPGMSGVEFLRRAKELFPETIRIVLSGFTEIKSITDAVNEGAIYKFFTKPWDDQQLRDNIAEAFRTKELDDENRRLQQALRAANRELAELNTGLQTMTERQRATLQQRETNLEIAREMLDALPAIVLGVDEAGTLVFSNAAARTELGPLAADLGTTHIGDLSAELGSALDRAAERPRRVRVGDRPYDAILRCMGEHSASCGYVMLLTPAGEPA